MTAAAIASTAAAIDEVDLERDGIGALAAQALGQPLGRAARSMSAIATRAPSRASTVAIPGADAAGAAGDDGDPPLEALHGAVPVVSVP